MNFNAFAAFTAAVKALYVYLKFKKKTNKNYFPQNPGCSKSII